jgi:hypothetical protein
MNAFKPLIPSFELMNRGVLAFRLPKKDIKGRKKEISSHLKQKRKNMSTVLSKEQAILKKIDNYVKGKLSEDEKDQLWVELCTSEELIDCLELELLLSHWVKMHE